MIKKLPVCMTVVIPVMALVMISTVSAAEKVRIGHFANLTHAQALIGRERGNFEKALGTAIDWKVFNAGPSAMEALLAGELDLCFVGPNPAVNAWLRSKGQSLKIIAGASSGGAALVVRADAEIRAPEDLIGKRIASPEIGNTQDVALRTWLRQPMFQKSGKPQVLSLRNADILSFFIQKQVDAAWVPEPWASRLVQEGGGRILLDERTLWPRGRFTTALVVVRSEYLTAHREIVKKWLAVHSDITQWIRSNPEAALVKINAELKALAGKPLPETVLREAMSRIEFTTDPLFGTVKEMAERAFALGYLPKGAAALPDLGPMLDSSVAEKSGEKR